ncbi:ribosome small subunit-dependent GTPase A [Mycoplasmopsis alligatoris]|uniref:Small ribosomal subunit biogenesis GTPase RsgA n=1 Tax=Mycoplasmopsis alligatoris A21JP2 TaxID=747682 RepID=D4XX29_9BACT|nr:ribosome small subunit-dependent GTPase A [Mycoplasmopsis alligatoris]EFF41097.1 ribosome small subunit-dependent GTPase A [Mycoplasmopsis alligatoris A21JP2]
MIGKVYSINAGIYHINDGQNDYKIPALGKLRFNNTPPLVGDWVEFNDQSLVSIKERKNWFIRPKVANVDQVIIVISLFEPLFQDYLLDKYLSIIEFKNIEPILFFTKTDLGQSHWYEYYKKMGYKVYLINNNNFDNSVEIKQIFKNKVSVFLGQSGVGKTSTINNLSDNNFETQIISKALGRGKHTTRMLQIIKFNDGELIDTPGFSSLDLDINNLELAQSFWFLKQNISKCKFRSCLHINENVKDCYVKQNIGNEFWPEKRYENYLKLSKETKKEKW